MRPAVAAITAGPGDAVGRHAVARPGSGSRRAPCGPCRRRRRPGPEVLARAGGARAAARRRPPAPRRRLMPGTRRSIELTTKTRRNLRRVAGRVGGLRVKTCRPSARERRRTDQGPRASAAKRSRRTGWPSKVAVAVTGEASGIVPVRSGSTHAHHGGHARGRAHGRGRAVEGDDPASARADVARGVAGHQAHGVAARSGGAGSRAKLPAAGLRRQAPAAPCAP